VLYRAVVDKYGVLVGTHALIVDVTKLALVVRIIEVCTFNITRR